MKSIYGLIIFLFFPGVLIARPLGWVGEASITTVDGSLTVCMPVNAKKNFPVKRFYVSSAEREPYEYWQLSLLPEKTPILMQPGTCVQFMKESLSYRLEGELREDFLMPGLIYYVVINRVVDKENPNTFYASAFCKVEGPGGRIKYLYSERSLGGEGRSHCHGIKSVKSLE